ncbi:preprotein translocase subunit SecE [Pseudactinotalea sp. Z1732]|uniref:preprotein translocase subunit SecE n=1 Tax=Pseudactinotalea sp. Z1732 TaxID=3413026 RepID=UPI003C7E3E8E
MSTSTNAPGDPGRDRDDDAADPDGAQAQPAEGVDKARANPASAGEDAGAGAEGTAVSSGRDVTKKVRQEARRSEAAARKTGGAEGKRPARKPTPKTSAVPGREGEDLGFFARIVLFVRQVITEIRKVVTPTRNELVTFSVVVVVFILAMMAYVGVLDYAIGRLVLWVFGN